MHLVWLRAPLFSLRSYRYLHAAGYTLTSLLAVAGCLDWTADNMGVAARLFRTGGLNRGGRRIRAAYLVRARFSSSTPAERGIYRN
jgi:hypothetical protein